MNRISFVVALVAALAVGSTSFAQDPDYQLSLPSVTGPLGGSVSLAVTFENNGGAATGLQYGVCSDDTVLTTSNAAFGPDGDALDTTFGAVTAQPEGYTCGILMNVITGATIASGTTLDNVTEADYTIDGASAEGGVITDLTFCEIGSPIVTVAVIVGGSDITPESTDGSIEIEVPPPPFTYRLAGDTITYNPDTGMVNGDGLGNLIFSIEEDSMNPASGSFPSDTSGFQCGIAHDDTILTAIGAEALGPLADINGGAGPSFFGYNNTPGLPTLDAPFNNGVTIGVVYSLMGGVFLAFDGETDVIDFQYEPAMDLTGDMVGATTMLQLRDDLGDPVLPNSVVVSGTSFGIDPDAPELTATIELVPQVAVPFVRGDANNDLIVNIADGIWVLNELFQGGPASTCAEAADANDDGSFDQTDAVYIFMYRFLDGAPPAAPFPDCGVFDGQLPDDCAAQSSCT